MYESRAIGTTRAFSVELGKHIKRTEYSDVRILCKMESHPINLSHSLRHLNIFSVVTVAFITDLHGCGSHISADYNFPLNQIRVYKNGIVLEAYVIPSQCFPRR